MSVLYSLLGSELVERDWRRVDRRQWLLGCAHQSPRFRRQTWYCRDKITGKTRVEGCWIEQWAKRVVVFRTLPNETPLLLPLSHTRATGGVPPRTGRGEDASWGVGASATWGFPSLAQARPVCLRKSGCFYTLDKKTCLGDWLLRLMLARKFLY